MKLTLVQADIVWEDKLLNMEKLGNMLAAVPSGTDIVILPEMFNTGFSMNPEKLSEPSGSTTFKWMRSMSVKFNFGICGSYIIRRGRRFFNTWIFVSPEGEIHEYDKRHLFNPGNENLIFTRGERRMTFCFRGIRILPTVCYDLRFPVWTRNRNDYDLLINSANWPATRREVWITLLKARAIENQCFIAGVNRVGTDGTGIRYCGDSMLIDPYGYFINSSATDSEELISGDISPDELNSFRNKFPAWKDADNFDLRI